jgi:hypothetical protein
MVVTVADRVSINLLHLIWYSSGAGNSQFCSAIPALDLSAILGQALLHWWLCGALEQWDVLGRLQSGSPSHFTLGLRSQVV